MVSMDRLTLACQHITAARADQASQRAKDAALQLLRHQDCTAAAPNTPALPPHPLHQKHLAARILPSHPHCYCLPGASDWGPPKRHWSARSFGPSQGRPCLAGCPGSCRRFGQKTAQSLHVKGRWLFLYCKARSCPPHQLCCIGACRHLSLHHGMLRHERGRSCHAYKSLDRIPVVSQQSALAVGQWRTNVDVRARIAATIEEHKARRFIRQARALGMPFKRLRI